MRFYPSIYGFDLFCFKNKSNKTIKLPVAFPDLPLKLLQNRVENTKLSWDTYTA